MNPQQALQILINLSNTAVRNGGTLESIGEAATVSMALGVLDGVIKENDMLKAELDTNADDSDQKF